MLISIFVNSYSSSKKIQIAIQMGFLDAMFKRKQTLIACPNNN